MVEQIFAGEVEDVQGLVRTWTMMNMTWTIGVVLLWIAAALTVVTGWDYFQKARPFLQENADEN